MIPFLFGDHCLDCRWIARVEAGSVPAFKVALTRRTIRLLPLVEQLYVLDNTGAAMRRNKFLI